MVIGIEYKALLSGRTLYPPDQTVSKTNREVSQLFFY